MLLSQPINHSVRPFLVCRRSHHQHRSASFIPPSACLLNGVDIVSQTNPPTLLQSFEIEGTKDRIRSLLSNKVDVSVSSYDTAWVAMVPSPNHSHTPCFPQSLQWLLDNQLPDGSWAPLLHSHPNPHSLLLIKDALSSTLASILALKRWGVGELQINHGIQFIESNFASATDYNQNSPIGFDIIFPGMLEYAKSLDLTLLLEPTLLETMLLKKESELRRCYESHSQETQSYLAYVSEGLGHLQDWNMVMKYQMKNGSILNSPSTTAATLAHHHDAGCLDYLFSLLDKFGDAVPTVDPLDLYVRLCMVDNLERLGIDRHFRVEIQSTLDETYRYWQQEDEQIFNDIGTCAIAFRVLRMNGYVVSSDRLSEVANKGDCFSSLDGHPEELSSMLQVYRASQLIICEDELALLEQNSRSSHFLKKNLLMVLQDVLSKRSSNINNIDFLKLAVEDYKTCQSIFQGELEYLERWVVENKLNELKFARQKAVYCYFSAAGTMFSPELSDARLSWAKGGILTTVVDDFFDFEGSVEELVNLIQLVEKWDVNIDKTCCSEHVRILFLAIKRTICEVEEVALKWQARSVKSHMIETWLILLNNMMKESVRAKEGWVPELEEYITSGYVTLAVGPIIFPALYLVGPKLSEEIVQSSEYDYLFKLVSICGRLLNDIQSVKRERKQGKLNAVVLYIVHSNGKVSEEEAVRELKISIEKHGRELLRLVLKEDGSVVPRACKDLFWYMYQILKVFYKDGDDFTSNALLDTVKSIIHEPVSITGDFA